jgi:hypothetical protein
MINNIFNQQQMKKEILYYGGIVTAVILFIYAINLIINLPINEKEERLRIKQILKQTGIDESAFSDLPLILGRREGCLLCHDKVKGMEESHDPRKIGCYSCHSGNRLTRDATEAHKKMVLLPGNNSNAMKTCGVPGCHPQMILRMQNSIMSTMNGVVSVDKWVFGESETPTFKSPVDSISFSPAEIHLRNLCASCHLSNEKEKPGPNNELSRGGGCLACHLNYSIQAIKELQNYIKSKKGYRIHPQLSIKVSDDHCFGCHSRSGRISLSYEGWHETLFKSDDVKSKQGFRILNDGRVVTKIKADIHSEMGMLCIDCHTSYEIMGDGSYSMHKEEQVKIQCTDCHFTSEPVTEKPNSFDFETGKISELNRLVDQERNYLIISKNNFPLVNSYYRNRKAYLLNKTSGEISEMKPPSSVCAAGTVHKNLSCNSCHSSWSPQCIGCHTEYDKNGSMVDLLSGKEVKGEWIEHPKDFLPEPAVLGVKEINDNGRVKKIIDEFTPGMVLTIARDRSSKNNPIFKRLYAPSFSHTIRKESRSCISCHNNPQAIGYGRGTLDYKIRDKKGKWIFTPAYPRSRFDGLPEDAWIGFLKERGYNSTTRDNTRPFTIKEQKRILLAGTCLTCHTSDSEVIKSSLTDFDLVLFRRSRECISPVWE